MTVLTAHRVMQTALVKVFLGCRQATVYCWTHDGSVFAIQHDMVAHVDALGLPVAASLCVWTFDHQLIKHSLDNLGHRTYILIRLDSMAARRTGSAGVLLGRPCMVEAVAAEVVFARKLDGLVKGCVADEADEVAVGFGEVFEVLEFGRDLDYATLSALG